MGKKVLEKLFGSAPRVRILRLLLSNPDQEFSKKDIAAKSKTDKRSVTRHLKHLSSVDLVKDKKRRIPKEKRSKRGRGASKKKEVVYTINKDTSLFRELQALVLKSVPVSSPQIKKQLRKAGKIKFALISGAFLGVKEARIDMLIVGENIQLSKLFDFIREQESEIGRELRYVILSPEEFEYRYEMFDRFIKDILETPHQKVINSLRIK